MKHMMSVFALAAAGALAAPAGAYAADAGNPPSRYWETAAAVMGPSIALATPGDQRSVIEPPSSIDPGMMIGPPETAAKMPIIRPPGAMPGGRLILPR